MFNSEFEMFQETVITHQKAHASHKNPVTYKGFELDLGQISFDMLQSNYSDLYEIYRLEGMALPIFSREIMPDIQSPAYDRLLKAWDRAASTEYEFEKTLPRLAQLPICGFENNALIKINFFDGNIQDFRYVDSSCYINQGQLVFTGSLKLQIENSKSANAILLFTTCLSTMLKATPNFTLHHTRGSDGGLVSWHGVHLPFKDENKYNYHRGVVSITTSI